MSDDAGPTPFQGTLTCQGCGKSADCTAVELLNYAQSKWPTCCGETMLLTPFQGKPGTDAGGDKAAT